MKSFHNDPAIKAKYQARMAEHRRLEHLTQGVGFEDTRIGDDQRSIKGCAVGCTLEQYDHSLYPIELGLPKWLAHIEDAIFEGLDPEGANQFAEDFLEAIPVGSDAEPVKDRLATLRLERLLPGLEANPEPYAIECLSAVRGALACLKGGAPGGGGSAAWSAESAARSSHFQWEAKTLLQLLREAA